MEKEQRDKISITSIAIIKSLSEECARLCQESTLIWTQLTLNLKLKEIEERVISAQEKVHKASEIINTLPPVEHMPTILVNK
jgi:hypothetical protein